jgi:hypothetical protein
VKFDIFEKETIEMSIESLLYTEIETEFEKLATMEPGSEKYRTTVDGLTKLMDRAIEIEKVDIDCKDKAAARESEQTSKEQQMKDDRKDRIVKNIIGAAGVVLPLVVTIWGTRLSLKFEETGTITTYSGRNFVQRLFHKK